MDEDQITSIFLLLLGGIGSIWTVITIANDTSSSNLLGRYTYRAPFTEHEITVIIFLIVSIVFVAIGLALLSNNKSSKK